MTIQWVLIAYFLYFELGLTMLLTLPFVSSRIWWKIICFPVWKTVERKVNMYFTVFIVVLVLFFLDSIRDMLKYSSLHPHDNAADIQVHAKLFRSQRNYYIVGFAIFLSLVIRRLLLLLVAEADLLKRNEEADIIAEKNNKVVQQISNLERDYDNRFQVQNEALMKEIEKLQEEILKKQNEIKTVIQSREHLLERCSQYSSDCISLQEQIKAIKEMDSSN